jgi:hypothetical protein
MRNKRVSLHPLALLMIIIVACALTGIGVYYVEQQQISGINDDNASSVLDLKGQIGSLKQQLTTKQATQKQVSASDAAEQASITAVLKQFSTALVANQSVAKEKVIYPYLTSTALANRAAWLKANPQAMNMVDTTTTIKSGSPETPQIDGTGLSATAQVDFKDDKQGFARVFRVKKEGGKWLVNDITGTLNNQQISTLDGQTL